MRRSLGFALVDARFIIPSFLPKPRGPILFRGKVKAGEAITDGKGFRAVVAVGSVGWLLAICAASVLVLGVAALAFRWRWRG